MSRIIELDEIQRVLPRIDAVRLMEEGLSSIHAAGSWCRPWAS